MTLLEGGFKLSELFNCSSNEQEDRINHLFQAALYPTEAQLSQQETALGTRIRSFECQYEMSSLRMRIQLASGQIKETADICSWLMLLKARDEFSSEPSKPRTDSF